MTQLTRILQKRSNCCGISHVPLILQTCPGLIEFWYDIHAAVIIAVGAIEIAHMFDLNIHGICKRIRGIYMYLVHINSYKMTTHKSIKSLHISQCMSCELWSFLPVSEEHTTSNRRFYRSPPAPPIMLPPADLLHSSPFMSMKMFKHVEFLFGFLRSGITI